MRKPLLPLTLAAACFLQPGTAMAISDELPGDIATGVISIGSYALTQFKDDDEGSWQFLRSTGASLLVNSSLRLALKDTEYATRPNGSPYGFPSGHAGFVGSSAAFLQDRYGWKYGLPGYAVLGYVSWVRVDTDHHKWRDVIAGAAVSYGISKLFVTPYKAGYLAPLIGPDFLGMRWERSF